MISIVIPSHKSEKTIVQTIKSVLNQDYKGKYEIIVVDSFLGKTPELIKKFPVRLIRQKQAGPAAARNLGAMKAKGDIIVFLDADCIAPKHWLRVLLEPFSNNNVAAVAGSYKVWNKESLVARFTDYEIAERHEYMRKLDSIDWVGSYNCAYRKNIFFKFYGFDTKMIQAEDGELSLRISKDHMIVFQHKAYVYHHYPDRLKSYLKMRFWRGYWKIFLFSKHKRKTLKNVYTPRTVWIQALALGFSIIFFLFGLFVFHGLFFSISLFLFLFMYVCNTQFFIFLWKKEKKMILPSLVLILLRDLTALIGISFGTAKLIIRKFIR